jgi:flagellar biogenesis protein FliO
MSAVIVQHCRKKLSKMLMLFLSILLTLLVNIPAVAQLAPPQANIQKDVKPAEETKQVVKAEPPSSSTGIPFKQERQSTDSLAYQSFAVLILASLAAYGIALALKRFNLTRGRAQKKQRRLQTLDIIRLSRRSTLFVVEYSGSQLLLAESDNGVKLLHSIPHTTDSKLAISEADKDA